MFDPQMLFNMLGTGGGMNFMNNNNNNSNSMDNSNPMQNPLMSMLGGMNGNMLGGLMQMFNGGGNNGIPQPTTGHNTYINNKISNNQNVNSELYHIIKNSESIL